MGVDATDIIWQSHANSQKFSFHTGHYHTLILLVMFGFPLVGANKTAEFFKGFTTKLQVCIYYVKSGLYQHLDSCLQGFITPSWPSVQLLCFPWLRLECLSSGDPLPYLLRPKNTNNFSIQGGMPPQSSFFPGLMKFFQDF